MELSNQEIDLLCRLWKIQVLSRSAIRSIDLPMGTREFRDLPRLIEKGLFVRVGNFSYSVTLFGAKIAQTENPDYIRIAGPVIDCPTEKTPEPVLQLLEETNAEEKSIRARLFGI